jgi:hypothetical protein
MGLRASFRRFLNRPLAEGDGVAEPAAGSTSFHLWWQGVEGGEPIVEASATIEVLQPPVAPRLYFWALQASFSSGFANHGAAHLGLQWNPRHAASRAVNWGGYAVVEDVNSVLAGSDSPIPSTVDDRNTRDFPWQAATPYRLRISKAPAGWRGEITDLASGGTTHVRDLYAEGDRLAGLVVWAEVFAACTDPEAAVRWSDLEVITASGSVRRPMSVRVTMPSGGCTNTNVVVDQRGLVQINGTKRTVRDGSVLPVPGISIA